jgi:hypothetical protein
MVALQDWNSRCQPPWSDFELLRKLRAAQNLPSSVLEREKRSSIGEVGGSPKRPLIVKPAFNPAILSRIAAKLPQADAAYFRDRSPLHPDYQSPASFLQRLYRPGEAVLVFDVFRSQGCEVWRCVQPPYNAGALDHLINGCPDGTWFLSNPIDGRFHPNPRQGGKLSRRSEESVTDWRYLVLESDKADPHQWLCALAQLPLAIASVCTSGGRSIHALVRVDATSKADWDARAARLKPILAVLGADEGTITAVRLTRLPGCFRGQSGPPRPRHAFRPLKPGRAPLLFDAAENPIWSPDPEPLRPDPSVWTGGRLQQLLYLDPEPDGTPICNKQPARGIPERTSAEAEPIN